ncbi:hypothetical protein BH09BAC5_BH09BAC5_19430 [soil metagenome]
MTAKENYNLFLVIFLSGKINSTLTLVDNFFILDENM